MNDSRDHCNSKRPGTNLGAGLHPLDNCSKTARAGHGLVPTTASRSIGKEMGTQRQQRFPMASTGSSQCRKYLSDGWIRLLHRSEFTYKFTASASPQHNAVDKLHHTYSHLFMYTLTKLHRRDTIIKYGLGKVGYVRSMKS